MRAVALTLLTAAFLISGCTDSSGPGGVPTSQLNFVRQDTLAPPLVATRDSFWAKVEDGRELRLYYQGATPADTGEEFVRFEVPGDGLLRKPDGSAFQTGDSILITITVVDPNRFIFQFEPAGLVFSSEHPARLKVRYLNAEHDFDGDGDEDGDDVGIERELGLWYQRTTTDPWVRVGFVKFEELDEISANLFSFSQYAVAW